MREKRVVLKSAHERQHAGVVRWSRAFLGSRDVTDIDSSVLVSMRGRSGDSNGQQYRWGVLAGRPIACVMWSITDKATGLARISTKPGKHLLPYILPMCKPLSSRECRTFFLSLVTALGTRPTHPWLPACKLEVFDAVRR